MFFNIFKRLSKEERQRRKIRKLMREVCKAFNPELISNLEKTKKYRGEVYFAIKEVLEDYILDKIPEFHKESQRKLAAIGFFPSIKMLRELNKKDSLSTFCLLVEIYARILTEEEFKRFFRDFLGFPPEVMEKMIFKNSNIKLKFQKEAEGSFL
jgi:hypothetical protein